MAYFATAADFATRTTDLITATGASFYAVSFWARQRSLPTGSDYNTYFGYTLDGTPSTYTKWAALYSEGFDSNDSWEIGTAGDNVRTTKTVKPSPRWRHFFIIESLGGGGFSSLWIDGSFVANNARASNYYGTLTTELLGGDSFSFGDLDILYLRRWIDHSWTAAQIRAEMMSQTMVRTAGANVFSDCPLTANLNDISGNGRHWTQNGSITFNSDVPGVFTDFPNMTKLTALDLPTGTTFIEEEEVAVDYPTFVSPSTWLWWRYQPVTTKFISMWPHVEGHPSDFQTEFEVLTASDQIVLTVGTPDMPGFVKLEAGNTYYLRVQNGVGTITDAAHTIIFDFLEISNETAFPLGSLVVNNDDPGYPAVVIDPATGEPIGVVGETPTAAVNFASGEVAETLPTGEMLASNEHTIGGSDAVLYDKNLQNPIDLDFGGTVDGIRRSVDGAFFYVIARGAGSTRTIWTVQPDGTQLQIATTSFTSFGIGVSPDGTTAYTIQSSPGNTVSKWDLTTDTSAGTFLASGWPGVSATVGPEVIVLDNGDVILYYTDLSLNSVMRRYSSAGTLLQSYSFNTDYELNHVALSGTALTDHILNLWYNRQDNGSVNTFGTVNLDTEAISGDLATLESYQFFTGETTQEYTPTPQRFGTANSCPFWVLTQRAGVPEDVPIGQTGGGDPSILHCENDVPGTETETQPDPVGEFPPFDLSCIGGGQVDTNSPLMNGELL